MLRVAIAFTYLLNGGYIPFAHSLAFGLLVWPNPAPPTAVSPSGGTA
jgi:hypothetical protein